MTVMFADLAGSTELSTRLDVEDLEEVLRGFRTACARAVVEFGGYPARYMGDGVLAYFGYPRAFEDAAERAVRAGLRLIEIIGDARTGTRDELPVRVGIATGMVLVGEVIGEGAAQEISAVGETLHLAARLQATAAEDTVVVAPITHQLTAGIFDYEDLGKHDLKGFDQPIQAWRALRISRAESRFAAMHGKSVTPLVGREHETSMLLDLWKRAKCGNGQAALICGDAGIGKSRLVDSLRSAAQRERHLVLSYQCSELMINTALHPFIAQLEQTARFQDDDSPPAKIEKLRALLARSFDDYEGALKPLATLLSIPADDILAARTAQSPAQIREAILRVLLARIEALASRDPVLMIFEDAHWADPTSRQLLEQCIRAAAENRVLALVTFRPGFHLAGGDLAHVTSLTLNRLEPASAGAMLDRIVSERTLSPELRKEIIAKADGIPLFLEELTKTVIESGSHLSAGADRQVAIPATLHDSLVARLDRLTIARELAQIGAAIGREFGQVLVSAVAQLGRQMSAAVEELLASDLVYARGAAPDVTYVFKHALVQDAAYQLMGRSKRREIHRRIAEVLERLFPNLVKTQPEILAYHWRNDSGHEQAVRYYRMAGEIAASRSANVEAIAHLNEGLLLLKTLPPGPARDRLELPLQLLRAGALRATKGFAAQETGAAYRRAHELCQSIGEPSQLVATLNGLYSYHLVRSEANFAAKTAAELLELAEKEGNTTYLMIGHRSVGCVLAQFGRQTAALAHFNKSLSFYDPAVHGQLAFLYGTDHKQTAASFRSHTLWLLGRPEQAEASQRESLAHAETLKHVPSIAQALTYLCFLRVLAREYDSVAAHATRQLRLSQKASFVLMEASARFWLAAARRGKTAPDEILREMQRATELWWSTGARQYRSYVLTVIAETYLDAGRPEEGLVVIAEGKELLDLTDERWAEPELHRVEGILRLALPERSGDHGESSLWQAIEVARKQEALMWELRSAVSLATLLRERGSGTEAVRLLEPIYRRFSEGFACPDLMAAKDLLSR
jgi:class 3 adenylate cyclase/predicted ATPase